MSLAINASVALSCESKAVSADGKVLHGAAKTNFIKKCKRYLSEPSSKLGRQSATRRGQNSFLAKCMKAA